MTIKNSKQLYILSNLALIPVYKFTEILISELEKKELVFNDSDNYGKSIKSVMDGSLGYKTFMSVIGALGLPNRSDIINEILSLTLFGIYDCPDCGGEMEIIDGEYKTDNQTGEKIPFWEEKQCTCCGYNSEN